MRQRQGGEVARVHVFAQAVIAAKTGSHAFTSHRTLLLGIGLAAGVVVVIFGIPLFLKKVRPNRFYGLPAAMRFESNTKWYKVNRSLGLALIVAGLITVAVTAGIWVAKPHAFSTSNKLLAGVEFLVVVVPAALAYVIAYSRMGSV
jgi:uncharacterized membrane protein